MTGSGRQAPYRTRRGQRLAATSALIVTAVMWLSHSAVAGDRFPRDMITFPFTPAAAVEGAQSLRFNPAGIAFDQGLSLSYYHTYSDSSSNGDDAFLAGFKNLAFSTEWLGANGYPNGRSHTIGLATGRSGAISFGSSYQWRSSDDPVQDKSHFWSHGATWRPSQLLSLAVVADNYNRMKLNGARTDAEFTYSAALNLLDGRVIVGGD